MTALLICLAVIAVVAICDSSRRKTKADWKKKQVKTNVKMQDELEKKFFVQIIDELKRMDSVNRLYGDELINALHVLYSEYHVVFPDVESHYVYQSKSQRRNNVYKTQPEKLKEACERYNRQLIIKIPSYHGPFSLTSPSLPHPSSAELEPYPLWRHIWLEYSPLLEDESPIIRHPELLYCKPYKSRIFQSHIVKYFDNNGIEITPTTKEEKYRSYQYSYDASSYRLAVGNSCLEKCTNAPVPVFLIDNLVVHLATEGLKRHGCEYSIDRKDSEFVDEQEKLKAERAKYPWLEEEDKKFK